MKFDEDFHTHYDQGLEQHRLFTWARVEWERTLDLLGRVLPTPPARVLDVGGGPGAYAAVLLERGYDVALVDPVELHVDQARAAGIDAFLGDARGLQFDDESADAVLLLGPLYHLTEAEDRALALREAIRVLRPGGVVAAAAISRFASLIDGIARGMLADPGFVPIVERDLAEGQHVNPDAARRPDWFTTAYFHRPEEIRAELEDAGLADVDVLAVEGPASFGPHAGDWLDQPELREVLMRSIAAVEREPSLLGASAHLLAVGRRP